MENYCTNSLWRICSERIASPFLQRGGAMVAGGNRLSLTEAAAETHRRWWDSGFLPPDYFHSQIQKGCAEQNLN